MYFDFEKKDYMGHLDFYSRTIALVMPACICDVEVPI